MSALEKKNTNGQKVYAEKDGDSASKNSLSYVFSNRDDLDFGAFKPKIAVIGVGGGGGNAVRAVMESDVSDILTIVYNTDAQVLKNAQADIIMQLGPKCTKGHGAGADPLIGKAAAIESSSEIRKHLQGVHVAFVVAGMGGGTGTGAAPEIARIAVELGILTIGFVTMPFEFESDSRMKIAQKGVVELQEQSDVVMVVSNQNLFNLSDKKMPMKKAFALVDSMLCSGLRSFISYIKEPAQINIDIADFFTVMRGKHARARIGTASAEGDNKGIKAAQEAMSNPLSDLASVNNRMIDSIIIGVKVGGVATIDDVNSAVLTVKELISPDAKIIFGTSTDESLGDKIEVSVFATLNPELAQKYAEADSKRVEEKVANIKTESDMDIDIEESYSFDDLLSSDNVSEDDYLGRPHSFAINEDAGLYHLDNPGFFKRIWRQFKGKLGAFFSFFHKGDDGQEPPYM